MTDEDIVRRANSWLYNNVCKGTVGNIIRGLVDEVKRLRQERADLNELIELAEERADNLQAQMHRLRKNKQSK
jgi:uncharacterized protein (UPF0305 family)